jgi:hypothetical protein
VKRHQVTRRLAVNLSTVLHRQHSGLTRMSQVYVLNVERVCSECCKNRTKCCICCGGLTQMSQMYVLNVARLCSEMLQALLSECCIGFPEACCF